MNKLTPSKNTPWMVVYSTHNLQEAHIVAGRLQHEGLRVMLHREAGAEAIGIHIGVMGVIDILVDQADYELALQILETEFVDVLDSGAIVIEEEDFDDDDE